MKISSSFLAKAADVKISLEANSKTLLAKKVASHPSLAAKEKRSYGSQKTIQGHFNDPDAPHQIKSTSCFLGFILCLCLLLHGPASWLSSSEFQNRVWKKIEITAKPAQNLALQATELQQTKVNLGYDIASGSSVYCNGDPVNGLDPDGRCVESTLNAVPGQAAWQQSVSSFNNGDYGQATLSFGLMLSEQALTVATFGMGSVASAGGEMASSVATETIGGAEVFTESHSIVPYSGQITPNTWPSNAGFLGNVSKTELQVGTAIDRYGLRSGTYVAPQGTPFANRGLPSAIAQKFIPEAYEVIQPLKVNTGLSAPGFGFPGLGTQHALPMSVQELIDIGVLKPK